MSTVTPAAVRLRVGPLCLVICVALYRAVWLSQELSGLDLAEVAYLLLADLPVLGILGILSFAEAVLPRRVGAIALVVSVAILAFYLMDLAAVLSLDARLQLSDLVLFGREWWVASDYISTVSVAIVVVSAVSVFIRPMVPVSVIRPLPVSGLALMLLPLVVAEEAIPSHLQKYTGSVLMLAKEGWRSQSAPVARYRGGDIAVYRDDYEALFDAPIARTRTNIVLVIVESLSASDSQRTSGIGNLLPRFDDLSRQGVLFRNFFANHEASEGGIVSLLSGVPPIHFPTASTNTFLEYSLQRSILKAFTDRGYRTEFLTSVPLQFISMDTYMRSPLVAFTDAAGQREIARYAGADRFAFGSPADHLLYEELLARLDANLRPSQPLLAVVVTASSHTPYSDPLRRADTESNVWSYVQDELWWLYGELARRGFFEHGLLIVTGDHRKMTPVVGAEREKYGQTAKARVPLLIVGAGVPQDVVDDRLFQQTDLLRMLDRAVKPPAPLSPHTLWIDRYVFTMGIASNAGNVQVFDGSPHGQAGYRLRLRGAEIEWIERPPNALGIERTIHVQRSLQQAARAATVRQEPLHLGRKLTPSAGRLGVLVGLSTDMDLGRDPDDPAGDLKQLSLRSFDFDHVLRQVPETDTFTLTARAFVTTEREGDYWFSLYADDAGCLAIDEQIVLSCHSGINEGVVYLNAGTHRFDLRFVQRGGGKQLRLQWIPPGAKEFTPFPQDALLLPQRTS